MQRLISLFLAVLVLAVPSLSAADTAPVKRPESIRITTLKGPTGLGMLELIESGSLRLNDGTSVPLVIEIAGGPEILDARILGKQVDAVTIPVNQAARLYTKGADLRLVGVNVWGVLYVISSDPAVKSWANLKGRAIMSSGKGSTTDVAFRELARRNGLKDADLNIDYSLGHVELMQLAAAGKTSLALLPEPFVSRVLLKNPAFKVVVDLQSEWRKSFGNLDQAQGGIALTGDFVKKYPEVAQALLDAYAASCRRIVEASDAPARIARQDFGLDEASARASLPRLNLRYVDIKACRPAVDAYLQVLFKAQPASIGGAMPQDGFYGF